MEVHSTLGPGLLESVYEECLCKELKLRGLEFQRQVQIPLEYKGESLSSHFAMDLVVERRVVVELKAVDAILPVHEAQLLTYLKLSKMRVGLLFNFNVPILKKGIVRRVF